VILVALFTAGTISVLGTRPGGDAASERPADSVTQWRSRAGFAPLSDAAAAAHVQPEPENRAANRAANSYLPSERELRRFRQTLDDNGRRVGSDPYNAHVTGHFAGTTDEIIQWAAWKWGIPEDWLRAQFFAESHWYQSSRGDRAFVGVRSVRGYPARSRERARSGDYTGYVWLSLGISQVKWLADGSSHAGTEPLRWKSTAFAADYAASTVRFYYDDPRGLRSAWDDASYAPGDPWLSIGGWYRPYPWGNDRQRAYVADIQRLLAGRAWSVR
jgi:hypothetical protein